MSVVIDPENYGIKFPVVKVELSEETSLNFEIEEAYRRIIPNDTFDADWKVDFKMTLTLQVEDGDNRTILSDGNEYAFRLISTRSLYRNIISLSDGEFSKDLVFRRNEVWGTMTLQAIIRNKTTKKIFSVNPHIWSIYFDRSPIKGGIDVKFIHFKEHQDVIMKNYKYTVFDLKSDEGDGGTFYINKDIEGIETLLKKGKTKGYRQLTDVMIHLIALNIYTSLAWIRSMEFSELGLHISPEAEIVVEEYDSLNVMMKQLFDTLIYFEKEDKKDAITEELQKLYGFDSHDNIKNRFRKIFFNCQENLKLAEVFTKVITVLQIGG